MTRYGFALAPFKMEGVSTPYDSSAQATVEGATDAPIDTIMLPTGHEFYAHGLIVGIDPDGYVSYGYDGGVDLGGWTAEDKRSLADLMIERWKAFKENS